MEATTYTLTGKIALNAARALLVETLPKPIEIDGRRWSWHIGRGEETSLPAVDADGRFDVFVQVEDAEFDLATIMSNTEYFRGVAWFTARGNVCWRIEGEEGHAGYPAFPVCSRIN